MTKLNIGWRRPVTAALLITAACGGASMAGSSGDESAGEATGADSTAGGDYGGAYEGGEMMAQPLGAEEQRSIDDYGDEVTQLLSDFEGAMELTSLDCGRAGELRDAICDLAEHICGIAADNPDHGDVADQCDDGRSRCHTARGRVDDRCSD